MENDKSYRACGGSGLSDLRNMHVAFSVWFEPPNQHYYSLGLRFFHFVSDLELLASSTIKLQKV